MPWALPLPPPLRTAPQAIPAALPSGTLHPSAPGRAGTVPRRATGSAGEVVRRYRMVRFRA
eukprot:363634-Chlamydomonas_euryale.AAC.10